MRGEVIMYKRTFIDSNGHEYGFGISTFRDKLNGLDSYKVTFKCHNVTILSNAYGDRVIIQEVKWWLKKTWSNARDAVK